MGKLKDQLAGIAALIAAVVAIGGGFATYGKLTEKISVLENRSTTDYSAQIAVIEEKVAKLSDEIEGSTDHGHTKILVNEAEIKLLKVRLSPRSKNCSDSI